MSDRTYTFPNGVEVGIAPISPLILQLMTTTKAGMPKKPEIPKVKIGEFKSGKPRYELNPDDPDYKDAVQQWKQDVDAWETERNFKLLRYVINRGVTEDPPMEWVAENASYLDGMDDAEVKYFWIADMLGDEDAVAQFTNAVMGQTIPTEEGVADAMQTFPADGEQPDSGNGVSVSDEK